jgi:type II secretory ATPase GspE/PulE/Tfp pilus assembly ATPase PilB-like protein
MEKLAVSSNAQTALVKFLVKLDLIDSVNAIGDYPHHESCPIAFFAGKGYFDEWEGISKVAEELGLEECRIDKSNFDQFVLLLDHEICSRIKVIRWVELRAVPIEITDTEVKLLMANPLDYDARSILEFELGRTIKVAIGREDEILAVLSTKHDSSYIFDLDMILGAEEEGQENNVSSVQEETESNLIDDNIEAAPIIRLVNKILSNSVHNGASDIHITPEKEGLTIRIRVDGIMQTLFTVPSRMKNAVLARLKVLSGMDISEKRKPQDGRMRIKTGLGIKDLRISSVPSIYGENIVARILSSEVNGVSFESLGMPPEIVDKYKSGLLGSSQVVLVTGPTGSGKTSTLYSGLLYLCDGRRNIITVEDPIEYRVPGITQIQVNSKIGMTFAEGLRSILRQDPDVIMVGEIRDEETAGIAMQVAQTGHLVLSTIHTNSAPAAITRLTDLNIPEYLTASSLGSVVAQRLVRTLCTDCAAPVKDKELKRCRDLKFDCEMLRQPLGCEQCNNTGFKGRTAIYSFLSVTDSVREAIRERLGEEEIAERAREGGYRTLAEDGIILLYNGVTSLSELERVLGPLDNYVDAGSGSSFRRVTPASSPDPVDQGCLLKEKTLAKKKVLLVEDDADTRITLSAILEREMFEVQQAVNGVEALELVFKEVPDFILCDLMMPKMSGLEFVKRLRKDPRTGSIPVLMLTAVDSEENELEVINNGANDFVSKSTRAEILLARIHALLARN